MFPKTKYCLVLPVHNGGELVKKCVKSVLEQSYREFVFIILDNASTDGTFEWLNTIGDKRVFVRRSNRFLSIEDNFARALGLEKGEYFAFIGHDDILEYNYLEVINGLVEKYPGKALYQTRFKLIDDEGNVIRRSKHTPFFETDFQLLKGFFHHQRDVTGCFMNSKIYDEVGGMPRFANLLYADCALLVAMSEKGGKICSPCECFSYRLRSTSTSHTTNRENWMRAAQQYSEWIEQYAARRADKRKKILRYARKYFEEFFPALVEKTNQKNCSYRKSSYSRNHLKEYYEILSNVGYQGRVNIALLLARNLYRKVVRLSVSPSKRVIDASLRRLARN